MASTLSRTRAAPAALLALLVASLALLPHAGAEEDVVQQTFASPDAAAKALIEASDRNDSRALLRIYGPEGKDIVQDGRDPIVRIERDAFAAAAREMLGFEKLKDGSVEILVGRNAWPFPILLVQKDGMWLFDTKEGKEEILARRIGLNELEAIAISRFILEAQRAYASQDRDGDDVREYAQKILSEKGKKDGLYWEKEDGSPDPDSPLGPAVISLGEQDEDAKAGKAPFNGYYWKILKGQGENAAGGKFSYVINGNMIAGFALVGVPARYMNTGVMTFVINNQGTVFEKDLGEKSLEIVKAMEVFDPDDTWKAVPEEVAAE